MLGCCSSPPMQFLCASQWTTIRSVSCSLFLLLVCFTVGVSLVLVGSHSGLSSPSTPVVPSKKPPPVAVVSPSSQPLPNTPQTPTPPFPPPFLNHTPRFPPPPFAGAPESPIVVTAPQLLPPQLPPQSSSAPFGPGVGQQNGPMVRPIPMPMNWAGSMVQPHPCPPPHAMENPGK